MSDRPQLGPKIHDSLAAFNATACWDVLRLAQMRQYLAEHLAGDLLAAARPVPADADGEPAELRTLPREVRLLVHAVDRMRGDWAEADGERRAELWRGLHEASDAVWNRPAVLPAPADRPAVLREGADAIDATFTGPGSDRYVRYGADLLRRLADEAQQPEAVAHRTRTEWIAEVLEDDGMWMYLGTGPDRSVAERRRASVTRRHPGAETRTVRKTTTYTVVADDAQDPAPADRGTAAAIDETAATIQAEGV